MKKSKLSILAPKFVSLDTASINYASNNLNRLDVKELMGLFEAGTWIPFVTYHHLEEIACHADDDVFERRWDFLRNLHNLAYLRQPTEEANVGSVLDLRNCEVAFLLDHPQATHNEIIEAVKPQVCSGFRSGLLFAQENIEWWRFFRRYFAEKVRNHKEEIVNLTHFPLADISEPMDPPPETKIRSEKEASVEFERMALQLEQRIRERGDSRNVDPSVTARQFMRESFEEMRPFPKTPAEFTKGMMEKYGIRRERLPKKPTHEDAGYEAIFVAQMSITAKNLFKNRDEILQVVRKERLPSWVVWEEVDKRIKRMPRAEIGNLNDKHMVPFGLYVDMLNVDKRIADILRRAARHSELLKQVFQKVPIERGFRGLIKALKMNLTGSE